MNKPICFYIWNILPVSMIMFMLTGCGITTPTITPTRTPPYIHYTPSDEFDIHLEFDYPSSWIFSEEKIQYTDIVVIGLGDPRFLTVPTRAPYESHGAPSDFGDIFVAIQPAKPGQTPDTELQSHKQNYNELHWMTVLNDYKIKIDEYDASVLEYRIEFAEEYTSPMFIRRIYFVIHNQMYEIIFQVAEKERGGEFEQGYEYFFDSLNIVP